MNELEYLKERSLLITDFILVKTNGDLFLQQIKLNIIEAFNSKNKKLLKMLSRDMNAWGKGLPRIDIKELEHLLKEKFNENLSGDNITHIAVKKALKIGKIPNEENFRVVIEYLNDITVNDPFFENIHELEVMINNFKNLNPAL